MPIVFPGMIAVALFGFTLSYDEFPRSWLTVGSKNTLPIEIWTMTTNVTSPALYALGTVTTVDLLRRDRARALGSIAYHSTQTVPRKMNMHRSRRTSRHEAVAPTRQRRDPAGRPHQEIRRTYAVQNRST